MSDLRDAAQAMLDPMPPHDHTMPGYDCDGCFAIRTERVAALRAALAKTSEPGLDVERLATALWRLPRADGEYPHLGTDIGKVARDIAAEYARLATPVSMARNAAPLTDGLACALARAPLPGQGDTVRVYAERLAPLVIESGYLAVPDHYPAMFNELLAAAQTALADAPAQDRRWFDQQVAHIQAKERP